MSVRAQTRDCQTDTPKMVAQNTAIAATTAPPAGATWKFLKKITTSYQTKQKGIISIQ